MDAHPENGLYCQTLLNSTAAMFVLFDATGLSRNGQVVQRADCRGLSAGNMSAQYLYLSDLSRPE
jgi:hypothetical protein